MGTFEKSCLTTRDRDGRRRHGIFNPFPWPINIQDEAESGSSPPLLRGLRHNVGSSSRAVPVIIITKLINRLTAALKGP